MEFKKDITIEELSALCDKELGLSLEKLIELAPKLHLLYKMLKDPIYIERFSGLLKTTQKEDPLECSYIKLCVIDLLKNKQEFQRFVEVLKLVTEEMS